jgi:hypothetical protein
VAEPKNPTQPKLRDWPMFQGSRAKRAQRSKSLSNGSPWPRIADLVVALVPGTPSEKLAWLRQQAAAGNLDGDDPDEIAQAEAMLAMLARFSGSKPDRHARHLEELVDEGLKATFPASDPVAVGSFTSTEPLPRPVDEPTRAPAIVGRGGQTPTRGRRRGATPKLAEKHPGRA